MRVPSNVPRRAAMGLVLVAGFGLTAVATEVLTRAITRALGDCHPLCVTKYDPTLGWTLAENTVGRHRHDELGIDVQYRIDANGAREFEGNRSAAGPHRVLVLGDSNGFGWGIASGRTFSARLQRTSGLEVINLSVSGYGTDQELLRFRAEHARLRPALVVIQVTPNDFDDIQMSWVAGRPKPWFTLESGALRSHNIPVDIEPHDSHRLVGHPFPVGLRAWLLRHSYTYHWLNERWRANHPRTPVRQRFSVGAVALFRALINDVRATATGSGAIVGVVHASPEIQRRVTEAIPLGVDVLDLSHRFEAEGGALFSDDLHWNDQGHRIAAEALTEWVGSRSR